jgi:hypothetical protein
MRNMIRLLAVATMLAGHLVAQQPTAEDTVRMKEFYRLAAQIQDNIWPNWSRVPAPLLLVAPQNEFLSHYPSPPRDFVRIANDLYARPRQYSTGFLATFPAFGPPSVIVVGQPEHTAAKTSTPWLITLMHEHFHQLQDAQPNAFEAVNLGLSHGDQSGMWMLNYPFPYASPDVVAGFVHLRELLMSALVESNAARFDQDARNYAIARKEFFAHLAPDDHKYLGFQLWKEGIARYTQIKAAEAAAGYQPTAEYASLPDYEAFGHYAGHARQDTLDEFRKADIAKWKREVVYSWGAAEGLLLDKLKPGWRNNYFEKPFSLDQYFE